MDGILAMSEAIVDTETEALCGFPSFFVCHYQDSTVWMHPNFFADLHVDFHTGPCLGGWLCVLVKFKWYKHRLHAPKGTILEGKQVGGLRKSRQLAIASDRVLKM